MLQSQVHPQQHQQPTQGSIAAALVAKGLAPPAASAAAASQMTALMSTANTDVWGDSAAPGLADWSSLTAAAAALSSSATAAASAAPPPAATPSVAALLAEAGASLPLATTITDPNDVKDELHLFEATSLLNQFFTLIGVQFPNLEVEPSADGTRLVGWMGVHLNGQTYFACAEGLKKKEIRSSVAFQLLTQLFANCASLDEIKLEISALAQQRRSEKGTYGSSHGQHGSNRRGGRSNYDNGNRGYPANQHYGQSAQQGSPSQPPGAGAFVVDPLQGSTLLNVYCNTRGLGFPSFDSNACGKAIVGQLRLADGNHIYSAMGSGHTRKAARNRAAEQLLFQLFPQANSMAALKEQVFAYIIAARNAKIQTGTRCAGSSDWCSLLNLYCTTRNIKFPTMDVVVDVPHQFIASMAFEVDGRVYYASMEARSKKEARGIGAEQLLSQIFPQCRTVEDFRAEIAAIKQRTQLAQELARQEQEALEAAAAALLAECGGVVSGSECTADGSVSDNTDRLDRQLSLTLSSGAGEEDGEDGNLCADAIAAAVASVVLDAAPAVETRSVPVSPEVVIPLVESPAAPVSPACPTTPIVPPGLAALQRVAHQNGGKPAVSSSGVTPSAPNPETLNAAIPSLLGLAANWAAPGALLASCESGVAPTVVSLEQQQQIHQQVQRMQQQQQLQQQLLQHHLHQLRIHQQQLLVQQRQSPPAASPTASTVQSAACSTLKPTARPFISSRLTTASGNAAPTQAQSECSLAAAKNLLSTPSSAPSLDDPETVALLYQLCSMLTPEQLEGTGFTGGTGTTGTTSGAASAPVGATQSPTLPTHQLPCASPPAQAADSWALFPQCPSTMKPVVACESSETTSVLSSEECSMLLQALSAINGANDNPDPSFMPHPF
eukprot:TRINITY_DN5256_c0_g1_i1.p1 TRINITY_DN5256_c0_g1~~TRINITY_DN5256_c0_g1_i1.p1  ORF type:complete len:893 (+),score=111.02 TRINITY_DN5256_c0_g1_i1:159-2837(+)